MNCEIEAIKKLVPPEDSEDIEIYETNNITPEKLLNVCNDNMENYILSVVHEFNFDQSILASTVKNYMENVETGSIPCEDIVISKISSEGFDDFIV